MIGKEYFVLWSSLHIDAKLISMKSFTKNRSRYMVSVMSLLNMRKPKGGLLWRENKAPCPLPILLITVLLPIYWCFILNSGILPSHSFLFASLARKNPLSFLWVPSHSVSHKNWNILLGWAAHFLLSLVPHRLPCWTGYMKWLRFNSSEESVLDYRFPPHLTPPPFFFSPFSHHLL